MMGLRSFFLGPNPEKAAEIIASISGMVTELERNIDEIASEHSDKIADIRALEDQATALEIARDRAERLQTDLIQVTRKSS